MKMQLKENNKGAAFVTVLIAILFISLISTSLLYMATMNYLAKSMRYSSTDNYYTAEYALADLGTTIQNIAAQETNMSTARTKVETAIGATGSGSNIYWTNASVEALIQNASRESSISVNAAPPYDTNGDGIADTPNLQRLKNGIVLKGVEITSTTDRGFETTIISDVQIVYESDMGKIDVNDFSVLTDAPVTLDKNSVVWGGYVFVGDRGGTGNALTLKGGSVLTFTGQRGIVCGDIEIGAGSTMIVYGTLTVYGNVVVKSGGNLLCTGDIIHTGTISGSTSSIKGIPTSKWGANPDVGMMNIDGDRDGTPDNYLASAILSPVYAKDSSGQWREINLSDIISSGNGGFGGAGHKEYTAAFTPTTIRTHVGVEHPYKTQGNELILDTGNVKLLDAQHGAAITCVGTRNIVFGETNNSVTYMTHLSDEMYDACKEIMWSGSGQITVNGVQQSFACSATPLPESQRSSADSYEISAPDPVKGTEGRTVYFKNGQNYIPLGYFISEDASLVISEAFAASQGTLDPKNNYIVYFNYIKE